MILNNSIFRNNQGKYKEPQRHKASNKQGETFQINDGAII